MPASMISAPTGGRLKVRGSSIAIAASGPMPGSTPTSVPTNTPMKQYIRFTGETAVWNPSARFGKRLAISPMSPLPEQWIRQLEPVDEQADRPRHQHHTQHSQLK